MRILFYHAARAWSGEARAFAALARGLSERGHAVTFVAHPESAVEQHLEFGRYEVLPLDMDASVPLAALQLQRALRERFVQVIGVHSEREQLVAAMAARLAERAAVMRRIPVGEPLVLGAAARFALRLTATGFVFGSEEDRSHAPAIGRARLPPVVAPLGVDAAAYAAVRPAARGALGIAPSARVLVCICDADARARAANVLRVIALLAPRHPDLHLVLIGPGASDENLRMHAAALRMTRQVSFLDRRDDLLSLLALADLGWVVASGDTGAYALLDLLASRVPVIAERGSVAQFYVPDGIAGLLLPAGDAHDAAAAVARLLAHEEQRVAMGSAAQARVAREYTESAMIDAFERAAVAASDRALW